MKKHPFLIIVILIFVVNLRAQQIKWYADYPKEVYEGSRFQIKYTLENGESNEVKFPKYNNLRVLGSPSTFTSTSIINGKKSFLTGFTQTLESGSPGVFNLGQAEVVVDGKIYTTGPINLQVLKTPTSTNALGNLANNIKAIGGLKPSKTEAYVGEQIVITYNLYYGESLSLGGEISHPDYTHFYTQPLKVSNDALSGVQLKGIQYKGVLLAANAIFGQREGTFTLAKSMIPLVRKTNATSTDPFEQMFGEVEDVSISTNTASITIHKLPMDAPATFTGAVGNYSMQSILSNNTTKAGEAIVLTLSIEGDGYSKLVQAPKQDFGSDVTVYEGKVINEEEWMENHTLKHKKTIEYLVSPKVKGTFNLIPKFTYFNPAQKKYITLQSPTTSLSAQTGSVNSSKAKFNSTEEKTYSEDLSIFSRYGVPIAIGLCMLGIVLFFFYKNKSAQKSKPIANPNLANAKLVAMPNSALVVRKSLQKASLHLESKEGKEFYQEIGLAMQQYIQQKFSLSTEQMTVSHIEYTLNQLRSDEFLAHQYKKVMYASEMSMYGGFAQENMQPIYDTCAALIESIELATTE
jgi:hypothetical protein